MGITQLQTSTWWKVPQSIIKIKPRISQTTANTQVNLLFSECENTAANIQFEWCNLLHIREAKPGSGPEISSYFFCISTSCNIMILALTAGGLEAVMARLHDSTHSCRHSSWVWKLLETTSPPVGSFVWYINSIINYESDKESCPEWRETRLCCWLRACQWDKLKIFFSWCTLGCCWPFLSFFSHSSCVYMSKFLQSNPNLGWW